MVMAMTTIKKKQKQVILQINAICDHLERHAEPNTVNQTSFSTKAPAGASPRISLDSFCPPRCRALCLDLLVNPLV